MTAKAKVVGPLLTVPQVSERLNVGERFVRRLIEERRIEFIKIGRHVRIAERALDDYIAAALVPAIPVRRSLLAVS
ncbi:excisionase family DNA-binding protein [Yinghuangia sp. YIM S09857]|uniref:excisionase family DNA-binding protein n=1 Tax=Yinghuangia sp. YIM S09857 TaxID=3436929 RepID=UPI003F52E644